MPRINSKWFLSMAASSSVINKVGPDPSWGFCGVKLTIQNIVIPEERILPTPSNADQMSSDHEAQLRSVGCELIQDSGVLLRLPQVAMATAQVLYQRFFYSKSFVRHFYEVSCTVSSLISHQHYAMACVFLAAKLEECPRRIRDIINVFHHIRQIREGRPTTPVLLDQSYSNMKNQVIKAERRVLKELGFCVHAKHPHKLIICYLKALEQETNAKLVQTAWNYMNDSLRTDLFVRYLPEAIACACIYLASCKLGIPLPRHPAWWEMFTVDEESVHEISLCLLRLYARPKPCVADIETDLAKLRKHQMEARERDLESKKQSCASATPPVTNAGQGSIVISPSPNMVTEKLPLSLQDSAADAVQSDDTKVSDSNERLLPPNSLLANAIATAKAVAANISASKTGGANHVDIRTKNPGSQPEQSKISSEPRTSSSDKRARRNSPEAYSEKENRRNTETGSSRRPAAYPNVSMDSFEISRRRHRGTKRSSKNMSRSPSPYVGDDGDHHSKVSAPPSAYSYSNPRHYRHQRSNVPSNSHSTSDSETPSSSPSPIKRRKKTLYRNRSRSRSSASSTSYSSDDRSPSHKRRNHKSRHRGSPPTAYRVDKYQTAYDSLNSGNTRRVSSKAPVLANGSGGRESSRSRHHHHKTSETSDRRSLVSREHKRR